MTPDTDTDTAPDAALSTAAGTAEDDSGTYKLDMTYTADGKIDFDALRAAIVAAVLPGTDVNDVTVTMNRRPFSGRTKKATHRSRAAGPTLIGTKPSPPARTRSSSP